MKIEIKVHEFIDLIRFSNQSEISLWILSVILYFNSPSDFSNALIWIHFIHIIRGLIGFIILIKLPRTYNVVEAMKNIPDKERETKLFNDLVRNVFKTEVLDKMEPMKAWLVVYFIFTFVNFIFDGIDFLYVLANLDRNGMPNNKKIIMITCLIINFLYLIIDMSYIIWSGALKYHLPPVYMTLINQSLTGFLDQVKRRLKIGKKETDIKEEAKIQAGSSSISSNIQKEAEPSEIHIEIGGQVGNNGNNNELSNVPYNNPSKKLTPEKYLDNEEQLDR